MHCNDVNAAIYEKLLNSWPLWQGFRPLGMGQYGHRVKMYLIINICTNTALSQSWEIK